MCWTWLLLLLPLSNAKCFIKILKYSIILKDKIDISLSVYLVISDMETETSDKGGKWNNEYSISFSGVHKSQIYGNMLELVYAKSFDIYFFFHKNLYEHKSSYRIYIKACEFRCQLYVARISTRIKQVTTKFWDYKYVC